MKISLLEAILGVSGSRVIPRYPLFTVLNSMDNDAYSYLNKIIAARSIVKYESDDDDDQRLSAETQDDYQLYGATVYINENFADFLRTIQAFSPLTGNCCCRITAPISRKTS